MNGNGKSPEAMGEIKKTTEVTYHNFHFSRLPNSEDITLKFTTADADYAVHEASNGSNYRVLISRVETEHTLDLIPFDPEEIPSLRKSGRPVFILKDMNKYWYCYLPSKYMIINGTKFGVDHLCALIGKECNRLSAAPDEYGGCSKVRNKVINLSKYPFVIRGFQTYGLTEDCCVIIECCNYELPPPRVEMSSKEKIKLKKALLDMYLDSTR